MNGMQDKVIPMEKLAMELGMQKLANIGVVAEVERLEKENERLRKEIEELKKGTHKKETKK